MALRRFYCDDLSADEVTLGSDEAGHARKTLRLAAGDAVELFDGAGTIATGSIAELTRTMTVRIDQRQTVDRPMPWLDLAVPTPKGSRADVLIESAAQLGVDRLILLDTERSVVDPSRNKQQRFERLAIEAAKQCGRAHLMRIDPPRPRNVYDVFREADADADLKLIAAAPTGSADDAALQALQSSDSAAFDLSRIRRAHRVTVAIGPEGGWVADELRSALANDFQPWRFGPHVLRIETAALAAAALVRGLTTETMQAND